MTNGAVPHGAARGTALVAAVVLMLFLLATGLGLALTAALEPAIGGNFEGASGALSAAEAGLVLAAHELASLPDWSAALCGQWRPGLLDPPGAAGPPQAGAAGPTWAVLTSLASCGQTEPCSPAATAAVTSDRPWGRNNPSYVLLGIVRVGDVLGPRMGPFEVGVWLGDDPSEIDGDPLLDGGPAPDEPSRLSPGLGVVVLRAEAFGPRGHHGAVAATLARTEGGKVLRLRQWAVGP